MEDNTVLTIGEDCMFSHNTRIWASDTHCIFDNTGKLKNIGKSVTIGNHVWFGENVTILKNTNIADNSIVGLNSVVHGNFDNVGSVICGNPARCTSIGNNWSGLRPQQYLNGIR
jgi:acetyltransferase-like isoleucine patch superfamily enzyme